jgi:N-acetylneuraminic acid mutarotase
LSSNIHLTGLYFSIFRYTICTATLQQPFIALTFKKGGMMQFIVQVALRRAVFAILVGFLFAVVGSPSSSTSYAAGNLFTWSSRSPAPLARMESQGAMVNGVLYVFGGFYNTALDTTNQTDAYDTATNRWSTVADMPEPLTHSAHAVDGTRIYLIGGYRGKNPGPAVNSVWIYDTISNNWSAGPVLPAPRGAGAAAIVGRELHFFSGAFRPAEIYRDTDTGDHWVLNLDNPTAWVSEPALPLPRNHLGAAALNGKIYVAGGQLERSESTTNQVRVDVYNPTNNTWSRAADMPVARGHIESSFLSVNGRLIMLGGSVNGGNSGLASSDVYAYDPISNSWLKMKSLPAGRKSPIAGYSNGRLYLATGSSSGPTTTLWSAPLPDSWEQTTAMPVALGEVAGGIIGDKLYLVGEGNAATLAYNLATGLWTSSGLATRPFAGNHHAAEVINGKLYLFGGLGSGTGKVQIYNPTSNSWSQGADMPFAAGSSSTALINGKVYLAGGIVGNTTTRQVALYDPALDSWSLLAQMPQGRNHAAAATDGAKFYVFGGRGPGSGDNNTVANGFDTLQIYNPATNSWQSSLDVGSNLAPLPIGRGGMGKAVFAEGKFYIIGGETSTGPGATSNNVYNRVDIYDPQANSWSQGSDLPTARQGIFPLLIGKRVYVAAGGTSAGVSQSSALEVYNLPVATLPDPPTPTNTATSTSTATPTQTSTATSTSSPTATSTPIPAVAIRLNTGGAAQAVNGVNWLACTSRANCSGYTSNGGTYTTNRTITLSAQSAPANATIYQSARGPDVSAGQTTVNFSFSVPNGQYRLRLHFAEVSKTAAGQRQFDVRAENVVLLTNYDIFAQAGGADRAVVAEINTTVNDGLLNLDFLNKVDYPRISGIEVLSVGSASPTPTASATATATNSPTATPSATATATSTNTPTATQTAAATATNTPTTEASATATGTSTATTTGTSTATATGNDAPTATGTNTATATGTSTATATGTSTATTTPSGASTVTIRLNAGGPAITNGDITWLACSTRSNCSGYTMNGGSTTTTNSINLSAQSAPATLAIYQSARTPDSANGQTALNFAFGVPNGQYRLRLHFVELNKTAAGQRVFSVNSEGSVVLANYDIFAQAGGANRAVVAEATVTVSDGLLNLDFLNETDLPRISGIEVLGLP